MITDQNGEEIHIRDRVVISRKATEQEAYQYHWVSENMDRTIGLVGTVSSITFLGSVEVVLDRGLGWSYPPKCLLIDGIKDGIKVGSRVLIKRLAVGDVR